MSAPESISIVVGEDEPDLWDSWSATSAASIVVDGQKLHDVLSAIRKQIEYLRKRQVLLENVAPAPSTRDAPTTVIVKTNSHDTNPCVPTKTYDTSPAVPTVVHQVDGPSKEDVKLLFEKVRILESRSDVFEQRIEDIEQKIAGKFSYFQNQIGHLSTRIDANSLQETNTERKLQEMEALFGNQLATMRKEIEDEMRGKYESNRESVESLTNALNQMKDVVDLNDFRLNNTEERVRASNDMAAAVKAELDSFPTIHLETIKNNILELFMQKADKADLATKADDNIADLKADQSEVDRLESLTADLDRKITMYASTMQDGFSGLDSRLEKRMDKLARWCLKYLKKEIKHLPQTEDARDGADIGRVRCLVCDQVVTQNRETDIVFGGPRLTASMPVHRRSPSPPGGERHGRTTDEHGNVNGAVNNTPNGATPIKIHSNSNNNNNRYTAGRPRSATGLRTQQHQQQNSTRRSYNNVLKEPPPQMLLPRVTGRATEAHHRASSGAGNANNRPQTADRIIGHHRNQNSSGPEMDYVVDMNQALGSVPHQVPQPNKDFIDLESHAAKPAAVVAATGGDTGMAAAGLVHSESAPALQIKNPFNQQVIDQNGAGVRSASSPRHGKTATATALTSSNQSNPLLPSSEHADVILPQTLPIANFVNAQEENDKYFKDLGDRFSGGGGNRLVVSASMNAKVPQPQQQQQHRYGAAGGKGGAARPGSAPPLKRSGSGGSANSLDSPAGNGASARVGGDRLAFTDTIDAYDDSMKVQ